MSNYAKQRGAWTRINSIKNGVPVFMYALDACLVAENLEKFCKYLPYIGALAIFNNWENGTIDAMETFCHICMVDPKIVELYTGKTMRQIARNANLIFECTPEYKFKCAVDECIKLNNALIEREKKAE